MTIIANHKSSKFIIYSDSKLDLLALQNKDISTPQNKTPQQNEYSFQKY